MSVWDPEVILKFKHTGTQAADAEWISSAYELAPDEVLEIYRIEVIPPVDAETGRIKKLKYVTLRIGTSDYESLKINSIAMPAEHHSNVVKAIDLGVPYLHRPITGRMPSAIEGACPKVRRGEKIAVKTVADESISEDYTIILRAARVKGAAKLMEVVGGAVPVGFTLDGEAFGKPAVIPTLDNFDELPGGLRQNKPQIFPWVTYVRNKVATTPNQWYDFVYDSTAQYDWMTLSWNLVNREVAYLVTHLGVLPHANSKAVRLYIEGRITNPEFDTRPLPEYNYFMPPQYYDTSVNAGLKVAGPKPLKAGYFLFHGVKGGIQIIDNGTAIAPNGVEILVYGRKFILK